MTATQMSATGVTTAQAIFDSFGPALQVGVDIPLAKNLYLNFDVKKVFIATNINAGGNSLGTLRVDPLLVGVGVSTSAETAARLSKKAILRPVTSRNPA